MGRFERCEHGHRIRARGQLHQQRGFVELFGCDVELVAHRLGPDAAIVDMAGIAQGGGGKGGFQSRHLHGIALGAGRIESGGQVVGRAQAFAGGAFEELQNLAGGRGEDHFAIGGGIEPDRLEMAAAIEEIELLGLGV
ncbi:hypothetical protein FQZ97_1021010 [compost metagenome]